MKRMPQVSFASRAAAVSPSGFSFGIRIAAEHQRQPIRWQPDSSSPACELWQHHRTALLPLSACRAACSLLHQLLAHDLESFQSYIVAMLHGSWCLTPAHHAPAEQSAARLGSRSQRGGSKNPWVRAAQAELQGEDDDDFSDLEDFVVCKEGRDYRSLFASHFRYRVRFTDGQAPG